MDLKGIILAMAGSALVSRSGLALEATCKLKNAAGANLVVICAEGTTMTLGHPARTYLGRTARTSLAAGEQSPIENVRDSVTELKITTTGAVKPSFTLQETTKASPESIKVVWVLNAWGTAPDASKKYAFTNNGGHFIIKPK